MPMQTMPQGSKRALDGATLAVFSALPASAASRASALFLVIGALIAAATMASPSTAKAAGADAERVQRGRYLVQTSGCNDCHTPGYAMAGGKVDEKVWLTGDRLGWRGPWGTTYASNLRLYMATMTQNQWLKTARSLTARPPMPWFNVNAMNDEDLGAIYAYVRALGPAGEPAPAWVPPDRTPEQPYVQFPQ